MIYFQLPGDLIIPDGIVEAYGISLTIVHLRVKVTTSAARKAGFWKCGENLLFTR